MEHKQVIIWFKAQCEEPLFEGGNLFRISKSSLPKKLLLIGVDFQNSLEWLVLALVCKLKEC